MPIRRGEAYLESLRDGRRLWLMGQPVEDVTTHPALAGCAQSVANVYDWQHDATHHELLTMPSPTTGQPVSLAYLLPESVDDLSRQRHMYEFLVRQAGGVAARLPRHETAPQWACAPGCRDSCAANWVAPESPGSQPPIEER